MYDLPGDFFKYSVILFRCAVSHAVKVISRQACEFTIEKTIHTRVGAKYIAIVFNCN